MAGNNNREIQINSARNALDVFLEEIASELGIPNYFETDQGDYPARVHGYVGGNSVRAFSTFAQNMLRSLPEEQGVEMIKKYGLTIPQEEKDRVHQYLEKMGKPAVVRGRRGETGVAMMPSSVASQISSSLVQNAQSAEQATKH